MVAFRPASVDEHASRALLTEYFALRADIFPGGEYTTVFPDPEAFVAPRGVFIVAEADDQDDVQGDRSVGCGGIRRVADGPMGTRYEVKHLYLRPVTRGRGWGRLLLADLERRARQWGAHELVLDTHHTLEAAAGLYASTGFSPIAAYNDNPNATRWYGKPLTGD